MTTSVCPRDDVNRTVLVEIDRQNHRTHAGTVVDQLGHERRSTGGTDALESLQAFYTAIITNTPRPEIKWTFERDGSITAIAKQRPGDVLVWQADNPAARNFRFDVVGPAYHSSPLTPSGPNTWVARVQPPQAGWRAFFVEMSFPSGGKYPLKVTSGVRILPDTLPFPPPQPKKPSNTPNQTRSSASANAPPVVLRGAGASSTGTSPI